MTWTLAHGLYRATTADGSTLMLDATMALGGGEWALTIWPTRGFPRTCWFFADGVEQAKRKAEEIVK